MNIYNPFFKSNILFEINNIILIHFLPHLGLGVSTGISSIDSQDVISLLCSLAQEQSILSAWWFS
jgi:hypothetical protein